MSTCTDTIVRLSMKPAGLLLAASLGGCAHYAALPLPQQAALSPDLGGLVHDRPLPAALTVSDVVRLAVLNNPDLRAARNRTGVAAAQLLQAGILPNPQASLSATPTLAGPGTTTAWNAGFTVDLRSLLMRPSAVRAARASKHQVEADLLWQEWQVAGQARLLMVQLIEEQRGLRLLDGLRQLLGGRLDERRRALAAGDATYATIAPDLAALTDAQTRTRDAMRLLLQQRHRLAALLGLRPDALLVLADCINLPPLDAGAIRTALPALPHRRPDLVALRWGYRAADEQIRSALITQFPNVSFGPTGGSDNTNVRAFGPQLSLELPVFDRGQGRIAAARATRQQLHDEYAARLAAADGDVRARLDETAQLQEQVATARAQLPAVLAAARAADAADVSGLIDPQARIDLQVARFTRQAELIVLQQSLLEQQVAIETLAGTGLPPLTAADDPEPLTQIAERAP
ncbi:TolC family protein [Lichenicoccus roseus]|uniref:TolC family protein n=1 Tax=Lichenicoccus roseus TaxID=2683649 RepID=UPI001485ED57|nr:TolC family protein [Lichenicoccus roseus]